MSTTCGYGSRLYHSMQGLLVFNVPGPFSVILCPVWISRGRQREYRLLFFYYRGIDLATVTICRYHLPPLDARMAFRSKRSVCKSSYCRLPPSCHHPLFRHHPSCRHQFLIWPYLSKTRDTSDNYGVHGTELSVAEEVAQKASSLARRCNWQVYAAGKKKE
jgi:hypothetical protein